MKRAFAALALLGCALPAPAEEAVVNGFRMHYESRGQGPAVVLLHGFTLDSRMWDSQRAPFKKYRVIAPDMRFHGRSAAPEDSAFDLAESAGDVRALLDHLKAPPEAMATFMKGVQAYPSEGAEGFRRAWLADPLFAQVSARPALRREPEAMVAAYNVDALFEVMGKVKPPRPPTQLDRLPEVEVRTLVMVGGLDQPHMIEAGDTAAKSIPGARKIVYPDAGHMINMEQPEKFNRDLAVFLGQKP